jgi:outer membrane biosynthesis protein TonB/pSer/pThr/pTyr-binding forkhead associated (FHA) protein
MALLLRANKVADGKSEILVDFGQVIIGRLASNNLVIPGNDVEPIHAMVEVDSQTGECTLIDMGSESGVRLNNQVIEVVQPIKPGDIIQIGSIRIEVLDPESIKAVPPPPLVPGKAAGAGLPPPPRAEERSDAALRKTEVAPGDLRKTVVQERPEFSPGKNEPRLEQDDADEVSKIGKPARIAQPQLFKPGKERPAGATLEVVAFWDQSILDVRHYGGRAAKDEQPRPREVYIGNEEDGHLIGVGPRADTRNYLFADADDSKTTIHLNGDMRARIRRGGRFEKVSGPTDINLSAKEIAFVRHGPIDYFFMNVALPNPALKDYEDLDGRPIIFYWAAAVYAIVSLLLMFAGPVKPEELNPEDIWAVQPLVINTPTPKPTAPPPKPVVVVPTPKDVPTPPPVKNPPTPKPVKKEAVRTPVPVQKVETAPNPAPKVEKPNKDKFAGRQNPKAGAGNSGGALGGTTGASAGQRQGKENHDAMGVENGKKSIMSGINLDALGKGMGKTMDLQGIAAVNTGLKSSSGGAGAGAGSGARNSHGFGGMGNSAALGTGGPANALAGLGGGAGGLGSGGLGGPGGTGTGAFKGKLQGSSVVVPEGDAVTEGNLTKEEIEAVIRANLAQIKACYERNLQGNRNLQGRVLSAFVIGTDGRVISSKVAQSTLGSRGTEDCIAGAVRRWKFPIPRGGGVVNVRYPFVLQPR